MVSSSSAGLPVKCDTTPEKDNIERAFDLFFPPGELWLPVPLLAVSLREGEGRVGEAVMIIADMLSVVALSLIHI